MKKIIVVITIGIILFLFSSCGADSCYTDETEGKKLYISTDGHESFPQNTGGYYFFRNTSFGCYKIRQLETIYENDSGNYTSVGQYICFSKDGVSPYVPLCSKPDCMHNTLDCNGYIQGTTFGLYDDKIFYLQQGHDEKWDIYSMELDGTDHKKVNSIQLGDNFRIDYAFDNEYLYYLVIYDNGDLELTRIKLKKGAEPEYYDIPEIIGVVRFVPTDGVVYLDATSVNGAQKIYRCALEESPKEIMDDSYIMGYRFTKDTVYYFRNGNNYVNGFYEFYVDTGKETLKKEVSLHLPYGLVMYDGDYIYIEEVIPMFEEYNDYSEAPLFYVFDNKYNLITSSSIPFKMKRSYYSFFAATNDYILFSTDIWPENIHYFIKKSEMLSEQIWYTCEDQEAA